MSRTLERKCKFCGVKFLAQRSTAKFCKPSHRTAYNRLPARIEGLMNSALDHMWEIEKIAKDHPDTMHLVIAAMLTAENYTEHKRLQLWEQVRHMRSN